jgi:hypothetical protein
MTYHNNIDEVYKKCQMSITRMDHHSKIAPEELSRKWNTGIDTAKDTLQVTMQHGGWVRTAIHPMMQHLPVNHLNLHCPRLKGIWYCDTLFLKVKSKLGDTCANVYTEGKFTRAIQIPSRHKACKSLIKFTDDVGILGSQLEWLQLQGGVWYDNITSI